MCCNVGNVNNDFGFKRNHYSHSAHYNTFFTFLSSSQLLCMNVAQFCFCISLRDRN